MMHTTVKALLKPLALVLILSTQAVPLAAQAVDDPAQLQQQAIQRLDRALEQRRKTGDLQASLGELRLATGELSSSFQSFLKAGNLAAAALSALKLGSILRQLDKPDDAQTTFKLAYELAVRANHPGHKVSALLGLAKTELYRTPPRNYPAVARYLDQAIALAEPAGEREGLCDSYQVKAELESEQGQYSAALDAINRSFPLTDGLKDPMFVFFAYQTRGGIYSERAGHCDFDRDAKNCSEALNNAKEDFEKARVVVRNLEYTALVNWMDGLLKNVEQKRALLKNREDSNRTLASANLFNPQRADKKYINETFLPPKTSAALAASMKPGLEEMIKSASDGATGNFLSGTLKDLLNEPDTALDYYLKAVKLLDSDTKSLQADRSLGTFLEDKIQIYYNPMLHLLERKRYAEAFDLMENSRSRAMADLLRSQNVNLRPQDQNLYAEYLTVTAKLSLAQQNVQRQETDAEKEVQKLEAERQNVLQRMNAANSNLTGLIAPQTATLQSVQQSMKEDRYEVLYYLVLDQQLIIWHLSADEMHVVPLWLPRAELIKKVNLVRASLINPEEKGIAFDQQTASELFLFLIQPALKWIKTDHLVIIPHEDLNYLPFQVFYDAENKKYLGEMFQLSYAPSATILSRLKKIKNISGGKLLAVDSSNLDAGKQEVKALGQLFSGRSKVVISPSPEQPELKESDLRSWIGDYDLVHLSIHGTFKNKEPLLSFLKLNPGNENEDLLTTAEMFGLPLSRAQLVVLSACETGQARATRANELIGMQRALLYAGANNLVVSSWRVDPESTQLWMTTFYREAQSKSFSEASRLASMVVRSNSKYSHPYYWSPFLLIGK